MKKVAFLSLVFAVVSSAQPQRDGWGGAVWVWDQADADKMDQSNEPRYLRRVFELKGKPVKASLWITADNHYVVYVNGHKVGADGEWQTVEKYDVARHLAAGRNVLAIEARNAGGPAGVIARLHVTPAKGKSFLVGTDVRTRISLAGHKDWLKPEFDDSGWAPAVVLGDAAMAPWNIAAPSGTASSSGGQPNVSAVDSKIQKQISASEQLKHFVFPEGFELELVASDPLVINPVTMALDEKGRIYVSESHTYRYGPPGSPVKPFANPLIRLDPRPDGKGYQRTLIADGFDDPVMGIAIKGDKLWVTANNFLYLYDLPEQGKAVNKRTILVDKNKAWNPFGMFVLEWGLDGWLYMSVGDHRIDIHGPTNKISGRGNSGIILRMKPDGSDMQRLVHGLRVPYSYECDPFGQLWLLSNGEGNPDRFVRVIDGVDYHCYSRGGVDNSWLAGEHPLAPPCFQNMRGAHTQLLRYYGAAYPEKYRGDLFCDNWGAHGFAGPNRAIFRFVPDARGNIVTREPFLSCTDPHFRPSHIILDTEGNLLIADWYGRDDESDKTGRIWRLKYTGKDRPKPASLDTVDWTDLDQVVAALGSPHHLVRARAMTALIRRGNAAVSKVAAHAGSAREPLGAAHALWTLLRIGTAGSQAALAEGGKHSDWKVRRLAVNIMRRFNLAGAAGLAARLARDDDPAVRLEAALARKESAEVRNALSDALSHGAAQDPHLRYEAAWHLAKHSDAGAFAKLLASDDEGVRLAGMIAIDVACFENFSTKPLALAALGNALDASGKLDVSLLLKLVQLDGDASTLPRLAKLIARDDLPGAITAQALVILKAKAGADFPKLGTAVGKRLIEAVAKGTLRINNPAEELILLEFLEQDGPTPFALKEIGRQLIAGHPMVRPAAHGLARRFAARAASLSEVLWPVALNPRSRLEDGLEAVSTLARIEAAPDKANWDKLLDHANPVLRTEAVRWWRVFQGRSDMIETLVRHSPALVKDDAGLKEDLAVVMRHLNKQEAPVKGAEAEERRQALAALTLKAIAGLSPQARNQHALLGRQVFDRAGCVRCHTTATQTTLLAPSLKGVAAQKIEYLVESVLYPSRIIKTGWETETIVTRQGKVMTGLVKDEGKFLRVLNLDQDLRIAKVDVEERGRQRVSIMPEGQEAQLSRHEFTDLIAYLMTLK
jgi:putative membrane-bound dehydrogenase-like protein